MYSLLHSFHRAGQISEKITKLSDISVVAPTTQHFLDETYSDSQYTIAVLHAYQTKATASAHLANRLKYKKSKISSQHIERLFTFQHKRNEDTIISFSIPTMLQENRLPNNNGQPTFYSYAAFFQFRITEIWRGKAKQTSLLMPPVSPEDETTNLGTAKVVLSLLVLFRILKLQSNEGAGGNVRRMVSTPWGR